MSLFFFYSLFMISEIEFKFPLVKPEKKVHLHQPIILEIALRLN